MYNYIKELATLATKAVLYEVSLSPKPGLVDGYNNGAHRDMTFYHFIDSAFALQPFFEAYLTLGYEFDDTDLTKLFDNLRQKGQQAEQAMFAATKQVNTHKGLNFAYAIILGAMGYHLKKSFKITPVDFPKIFSYVQAMTSPLVERDLFNLTEATAQSYGEKLYVRYGIQGPRGEAAQGYPHLINLALPYIQKRRLSGIDDETIYLEVLLLLMSTVEDGNIINRGGIEAWQQVKKEAKNLFAQQLATDELRQALIAFDHELTERYLSPGGSADLLSLSIFLSLIE